MSRPASRIHLAAAALILFSLAPAPVQAQTPATSPGALRSYSTIYSIGVEWDIAGDANHNAVASVDYRVAGTGGWKDAMPLMRVDYNAANMLAGSVLFLTPRTSYEIRLTLTDPDGGAAIREVTQATRALPALPAAGRTMHVIPGTGGGFGTAADPFKGIAAAQAAAQAGDILLVHAGNYGGRIRFDKPGAVDNYLVRQQGPPSESSTAQDSTRADPFTCCPYDAPEGLEHQPDRPMNDLSRTHSVDFTIAGCADEVLA